MGDQDVRRMNREELECEVEWLRGQYDDSINVIRRQGQQVERLLARIEDLMLQNENLELIVSAMSNAPQAPAAIMADWN